MQAREWSLEGSGWHRGTAPGRSQERDSLRTRTGLGVGVGEREKERECQGEETTAEQDGRAGWLPVKLPHYLLKTQKDPEKPRASGFLAVTALTHNIVAENTAYPKCLNPLVSYPPPAQRAFPWFCLALPTYRRLLLGGANSYWESPTIRRKEHLFWVDWGLGSNPSSTLLLYSCGVLDKFLHLTEVFPSDVNQELNPSIRASGA